MTENKKFDKTHRQTNKSDSFELRPTIATHELIKTNALRKLDYSLKGQTRKSYEQCEISRICICNWTDVCVFVKVVLVEEDR